MPTYESIFTSAADLHIQNMQPTNANWKKLEMSAPRVLDSYSMCSIANTHSLYSSYWKWADQDTEQLFVEHWAHNAMTGAEHID